MTDENKVFSQEQLDAIIRDRLSREKEKYDELNNKYNSLNSEHTNLTTKVTELESQLGELPKLQRQNIVNEVARELKVPDLLVNRLAGNTKEEILEDAKSLMSSLGVLDYKGLPQTPAGKGQPKKEGYDLLIDNIKKI